MNKNIPLTFAAAILAASATFAASVAHFVEYIESDGNMTTPGEYVLLDYTPTSTSVVEAEVMIRALNTTHGIFCARGNTTGASTFTLFYIADNGFRWDYNRTTSEYQTIPAVDVRHTIRCTSNGLWLDGVKSSTISVSPANYTPANKMMLFASYTCKPTATPAATGNYAKMRLYSFKAWDGNGATLRVDLRPCVDTDGVAGLYDDVTGKIYYNLKPGKAFTTGSAVPTLLTIEGHPFDIGEVSPAYGTHTNAYLPGTTTTCTAPATVSGPGLAATCAGYELYRGSEGNWTLASSGEGNSCPFTASILDAKLVWHWSVVADLGVSWGGEPIATRNSAILPATVTGLGASGLPASLKAAWGYAPDNLVFTNALATVSALGATNVTLSALHPGRTYYVRLLLDSASDGIAESDTLAVTTAPVADIVGLPGLIQSKKGYAWYQGDWDIAGSADADRTLGANASFCGSKGTVPMPWTSADGGTTYDTWGDNTTWAYAGYMYFSNLTYTVGGMMDDTVRLVIDGETVLYQSGSTLVTATWTPPHGEGWYPIEIRVGNGTGGYGPWNSTFNGLCWNVTGYTTADTSSKWHLFLDPGDGSLLRTGVPTVEIASMDVADGALSAVHLSFPRGTAAGDLHVAWGAEHGGDELDGWSQTDFVAATTDSTTQYAYSVPATWGSPSNLVMRFYLDHGGYIAWSPSIHWQDVSVPVVSATATDGSGGDTLVVTGTVASFPGERCTLTVYTGDSPDTMTNVWANIPGATLAAPGDFSLTLCETDATSPRYLAPGTTVHAIVRATAEGRVGTGPTVATALPAEAGFSAFYGTATRRMVEFRVRLSTLGANPPARATLWIGDTDDESTFVQAGDPVLVEIANFSSVFTNTFDRFETTYYAQIRVTNTTAGATASFEARSPVISVQTLDTTIYTWKNEVVDGDWSNPANWSNDQSGDCLGYPQSTNATAVFPALNSSTVRLTEPISIAALNLSAGTLWTTFTHNGPDNDDARLTVATAINFNGSGGNITFSNTSVYATSGTTAYGARTVTVRDGASLYTGNITHTSGGAIRVEAGGFYRPWNISLGGDSLIVVSNGTLNAGGDLFLGASKAGGAIRLEGAHPVLVKPNGNYSFYSALANAGASLDFLVPVGGYDEPPVRCGTAQSYLLGNKGGIAGSSVIPVRVLAESPAARDGATITTPLVAWARGINTARVSLASLVDVPSTMLYGTSATDDYGFTDAASFSGTPYAIGVTIEGDDHGDRLSVTCAPFDFEVAGLSPAHGDHDGYASGATVTCTAPSGVVQISDALRGSVTGGTLYTVDAQTGLRTAVETFTGTSCSYTADGRWHEVEWAWDLECLVTTVSGGHGSVSGAVSGWYAYGASATISATADAGYAFAKWQGDLLSGQVLFDNPCTFTVAGPMTNTAAFWGVVHVSPKGSDSNGGTSWADAKKTIAAAVASRDTPYVLVSNGNYAVTAMIDLSKPAIVSGLDDGCGAVVYLSKAPSANTDLARCVFHLAHDGAVLRRVAVAGTATGTSSGYARGIYIQGAGLVDHCVITNNHAWKDGAYGAGVWISNGGTLRDSVIAGNVTQKNSSGGGVHISTSGLIERCVITNNINLSSAFGYYGGGVSLNAGGIIRDSLVAGNTCYTDGGGIGTRQDGLIENCTIVGNTAYGTGPGGLLLSATSTIRNSVVWGNANDGGASDWAVYGIYAKAERCTSPTALPGDGNIAVDPAFANPAAGDYRLGLTACVDAGVVTDGMDRRLDLDGKARVLGSGPDLGCYERTPSSGLDCGFSATSDGGVGTAACTFEASVAGDNLDGLVYTWRVTGSLGYDQTRSGAGLSTLALNLPAGIYSVSLGVTNALGSGAAAARESVVTVLAADTYVAPDGGHVYPFGTWAHAATNIAEAIDATGDGGTIHLADGFYTMPGPLAVTRGLRLVSSNGPEKTTIYAKVSTTDGNYSPVLRIAHADAVVSGITVSGIASNGTTRPAQYGGVQIDAAGGTLTNCVVSGHYRTQRPNSVIYGALNGTGGRAYGGHVIDCVFRGNNNTSTDLGCGLYIGDALVERCVISNNIIATATTDNTSSYGGGLYVNGGTVRNCLIAGNFNHHRGGGVSLPNGTLENCTIVHNQTGYYSTADRSGLSIGENVIVADCIVCLNSTAAGAYDDEADPGFADAANGDYRLVAASPAVDAGSRTPGEGERDLDGAARVSGGAVDLGCYELDQNRFSLGIGHDFLNEGPGPADIRLTAVAPAGFALDDAQTWWTIDGTEPSAANCAATGTNVVLALAPGLYTVRAKTVHDGETYSAARIDWFRVCPETVYVVATPGEAPASAAPYATWATAATNLADAIVWAGDGTTVLLGDGVHVVTNEITVSSASTVKSLHGPGATAVSGNRRWRPFLLLDEGAVLSGITVTNGVSSGLRFSGGVNIQAGMVSNCVIVACTANNTYPAGLHMEGGLFVDSVVTNCGVTGTAEVWGCAACIRGGVVDRCRIVGNVSSCTKARAGGIQVSGAILRNSLVAGNSAAAYAGVRTDRGGLVENCTVVGNITTAGFSATDYNAGIACNSDEDRIVNCVSWGNIAPGSSPRVTNSSGTGDHYSNCALPVEWGENCVTNAPGFLGRPGREYDLSPNSPCRNAGALRDWMDAGSRDLLRRPRVRNKLPDIGAYEVQSFPLMLLMQ